MARYQLVGGRSDHRLLGHKTAAMVQRYALI